MNPDECEKACGKYVEPDESFDDHPMGKVINITDYLPQENDGPWFVFKDPRYNGVHIVNHDGLIDLAYGALDLDNEDRQAVARSIIMEWLCMKGVIE